MKVNVSNERSRVKRDNFMLILLISGAALTVHQWAMESGISEGLKFLPKRERLRKTARETERGKKRDGNWGEG